MIGLRNKNLINARVLAYFLSAILVASATFVTLGLWSIVNPLVSPLFLVAIMVSAWRGGFRSGVFSTVLSGMVLDYVFIDPEFQVAGSFEDVIRLSVFLTEGIVLSWLIEVRRVTSEKLEESHRVLQELASHQENLRETEQKRIALEIHDELGQSLTGLKLEISWLKAKIETFPDDGFIPLMLQKLGDLSAQVDMTIGTVRRIATALRPSILDDFGLVAAIEWQAKEFERKSLVRCHIESNFADFELDSESSTALFRIFQESLTNVARHAEASNVLVELNADNMRISMRVSDDGIGINHSTLGQRKSLGIMGMRERARSIGGKLDVFRSAGGGTVVEVIIGNQIK